jgi:hypothetical protein
MDAKPTSDKMDAGETDANGPGEADAGPGVMDAGGTDEDGGRPGCGDGTSLVCRRGCGDGVREGRPICDGDTWRCRWGGALEDRATPPHPCDGG